MGGGWAQEGWGESTASSHPLPSTRLAGSLSPGPGASSPGVHLPLQPRPHMRADLTVWAPWAPRVPSLGSADRRGPHKLEGCRAGREDSLSHGLLTYDKTRQPTPGSPLFQRWGSSSNCHLLTAQLF